MGRLEMRQDPLLDSDVLYNVAQIDRTGIFDAFLYQGALRS